MVYDIFGELIPKVVLDGKQQLGDIFFYISEKTLKLIGAKETGLDNEEAQQIQTKIKA